MAVFRAIFLYFLVFFVLNLPSAQSSGFPCSSSQYTCKNQRCVQKKWRCDGMDDCGDNSDEANCPPRTCSAINNFTCNNGRCIRRSWVCDGANDCGDKSDEKGCPTPTPQTCPPNEFTCKNGRCILRDFLCDDEDDCGDGSDEVDCARTCTANEFKCDNGRCISKDFLCDHEDDCNDMSDERGCANRTCGPSEFTCSLSGRCIPARFHCDGNEDCLDSSDEHNCQNVTKPTRPPAICRKNERVCDDGTQCVHRDWICDGSKDCRDGSDEKQCGIIGCTGLEFTCSNQVCIPKDQRCDGKDNCGDNSDERSCPTRRPVCPQGTFQCGSSKTCISTDKVCDGNPQCPHGEDERNCFINECKSNNGHCLHICTDTKTSFYCSCKPGYELMEDGKSCRDINECEIPGMCSQNCFDFKGGFKCSCLDGYVLEPDKRRCKAQGPRPYLLFTNRNSIRLIMTDGKEYKSALKNLHDAQSLNFDFEEGMLYWTDGQHASILRAKMGTILSSKIENVVSEGIVDATGIAIDWVGKKIYWSDSGSNSILVAETNGKNKRTLISSGLDKPSSIVVDPSEGTMYWIDWGSPAKIERASMDGTNRRVLISGDHIERPSGLAIDYTTRKLYWVDSKLKTIKHCSLNGTAIRELVNHGLKSPSAVTVFEDNIYWTDSRSIYKANKFTGQNKTMLVHNAANPQDAHIYHPQRQPSGSNPCGKNNGGCSHLCLLSNHQKKFSCACPDGLYLQKNFKTCAKHKPIRPNTTPQATTVRPSADVLVNAAGSNSKAESSSPNAGLIIGIVVGVMLLVLAVVIIFFFVVRKKRSQKLEILYNAESQNDVDRMTNGTAGRVNKKPDIKNRSEYKHFANINYEPTEPQTPPPEDDMDEVNIEVDETQPVIRNSVV